ncbi:MAG: ABC transporter ATP-binding protein [Tidjanibacter sp.]|nr:ABC transporter ATP-binding protein [Tidjanibacter sp.]
MIKVKNLEFSYRAKRHIFRDLSLSVDAGQICGLLGSNGIGKSTLLKLLSGLLTPNCGSVTTLGEEAQQRTLSMLQEIAYLPEEFSLPNIRVKDWVAVTTPFYGSFDHAFFAKAMGEFEVNEGEKFGSLSMGQRKKVLIAFAMACSTSLLLLDEPTNGLDITSKQTFRRLLAEWATPSRTAIISTHQVKDVENLLDHIIILDSKGMVVDASTYDISRYLRFAIESSPEGAIYSQPALGGYATVSENTTESESNIDIELLFGAATKEPQRVRSILNPSTK